MTHFAWMTGETILQLRSEFAPVRGSELPLRWASPAESIRRLTRIGPWTITYVRPEDDPRSPGHEPSVDGMAP